MDSTTKSNLNPTNQSLLQSTVRPGPGSSSSSSDLARAVRQALSEGIGGEQVLNIAREETANEVDYVPLESPDMEQESVLSDPPPIAEEEKPKRKRRGKNATN